MFALSDRIWHMFEMKEMKLSIVWYHGTVMYYLMILRYFDIYRTTETLKGHTSFSMVNVILLFSIEIGVANCWYLKFGGSKFGVCKIYVFIFYSYVHQG